MNKTKTAIFGAFGEVSAPYWRESGMVFDSEAAEKIGEYLLAIIKTDMPLAIEILQEAIKDESYRQAWVANIAMAFKDEYARCPKEKIDSDDIHEIANKAAGNFMDLLTSQGEALGDNTPGRWKTTADSLCWPAYRYQPLNQLKEG